MKKLILLLFLISAFMLTSCSTDEAIIHTQEMPTTEQEWGNTLMHWYPDWEPPVVVTKE